MTQSVFTPARPVARRPLPPRLTGTPAQPATPPAVTSDPRLGVHLLKDGPCQDAHLEYDARPGSLLGGPFATRRTPRWQQVNPSRLADVHLAYLRGAYSRTSPGYDPEVRALLSHLAACHAYGQNRQAVVCEDDVTGRNVVRAALALAAQLPAWPELKLVAVR